MADVFVSYDRRDREIAEKVVSALTEQGLTVWWDDRITPHETWDKTIEREVDSAKRVLVIWTNNSVQSDWVRTEAGAAKESTPPKLIQARFTDCKVPLAFRLLQHVDLIGWTPKRKHSGWDRLIGWLKDGLDQPAAPAPGGGGPIPPEAPTGSAPMAEPAAPSPTVEAADTEAPAPAPAASAPMGFADLSKAEPEAAPSPAPEPKPAPAPEPSVAQSTEPPVAQSTEPKREIPRIEMPSLGSGSGGGGGIDKRLLIGGAVAVVVGIGIAIALTMNGGSGGSGGGGGGFSGEERGTLGGYLDGYAAEYAPGLEAVMDDELARIAAGDAYDFEVELGQGDTVRVLGACDANCSDVDLYVTGPDGAEIGSDTLLDDYPVVEIPNTAGGVYTIRIAMPGCSADTCIGAARLYAVE